eukprot:6587203-Alexandrium_andersonii.AAC.1
MTARLMNICRVVSQGQIKSRTAAWVAALPWRAQQAGPAPSASSAAPQVVTGGSPPVSYTHLRAHETSAHL